MLIVIVTGLVFSFRNQAVVSVDFLFYQFPSFSIGFWILSTLIVGVLLGIFLSYPKKLFQSIRIKRLSKKMSNDQSLSPKVKTDSAKGH